VSGASVARVGAVDTQPSLERSLLLDVEVLPRFLNFINSRIPTQNETSYSSSLFFGIGFMKLTHAVLFLKKLGDFGCSGSIWTR
jgi:hypothetical protein